MGDYTVTLNSTLGSFNTSGAPSENLISTATTPSNLTVTGAVATISFSSSGVLTPATQTVTVTVPSGTVAVGTTVSVVLQYQASGGPQFGSVHYDGSFVTNSSGTNISAPGVTATGTGSSGTATGSGTATSGSGGGGAVTGTGSGSSGSATGTGTATSYGGGDTGFGGTGEFTGGSGTTVDLNPWSSGDPDPTCSFTDNEPAKSCGFTDNSTYPFCT